MLNASGYVVARRRATVSSKVTGKVVDVLIEEGHPVKEGQILAHLDDTQARATLALAEAQLASPRKAAAEDEARVQQAELTLQRRQQLLKEGVIGKAEVDEAQSNVDSLEGADRLYAAADRRRRAAGRSCRRRCSPTWSCARRSAAS